MDGFRAGVDDDLPFLGVEQNGGLFGKLQEAQIGGNHQRNLERLGENSHVGMLPAAQKNQPGGAFGGQFQNIGREQLFGQDNLPGIVGAGAGQRGCGKVVEKAVAEVFHIENFFAQGRIGAAAEHVRVVADFIKNGGPWIFSGADLIANFAGESFVLEHQDVRAENHGGGVLNFFFEPPLEVQQLAFGDGDGAVKIGLGQIKGAGLFNGGTQQIMADAGGQAHGHAAGGPLAADAVSAGAEPGGCCRWLLRDGLLVGGGIADMHQEMRVFNHAGELGGNDAQGLNVVVVEIIPLGVLNGDDPHRIHLALDGHREKGNEFFLVAAGNILEMGVVGRARLANGAHFLERHAGDAFANLEAQASNHGGIQPLIGVENQIAGIRIKEINGANGGAHMPGDR